MVCWEFNALENVFWPPVGLNMSAVCVQAITPIIACSRGSSFKRVWPRGEDPPTQVAIAPVPAVAPLPNWFVLAHDFRQEFHIPCAGGGV